MAIGLEQLKKLRLGKGKKKYESISFTIRNSGRAHPAGY